jgi:hypothetical protein
MVAAGAAGWEDDQLDKMDPLDAENQINISPHHREGRKDER